MYGIVVWFGILILGYTFLTYFRQWYDANFLILVAIGTAINANIYTSVNYPVTFGGFKFAIDSILFMMFMHTVFVYLTDYDETGAKGMTITTMKAILLSAFIEFFARTMHFGLSINICLILSNYIISVMSAVICIWSEIFLYKFLCKKSFGRYTTYIICLSYSGVLNTILYYIILVATKKSDWSQVTGSVIGKILCVIAGVISYKVNDTFWKPCSKIKKN